MSNNPIETETNGIIGFMRGLQKKDPDAYRDWIAAWLQDHTYDAFKRRHPKVGKEWDEIINYKPEPQVKDL